MDEFEKALDDALGEAWRRGFSNADPRIEAVKRAHVIAIHRAALEDAERYRWLRDSATDYTNEIAPVILVKDVVTGDDMLAEEKLDEAIDAARSKS